MTKSVGRLYVIGDKETGVLFVKSDPLRAAVIRKETIAEYADEKNISFELAFAKIAEAAKRLIIMSDMTDVPAAVEEVFETFGSLVASGSMISDAEFCFIADVENEDWNQRRWGSPPLQSVLEFLDPDLPNQNPDHLPEGILEDPPA